MITLVIFVIVSACKAITIGLVFGMNFKTWAPLWSGIVESSIWDEPDNVVKVFLTMLAIKDADHVVRKTAYQLGVLSRKTESEVLDALKILASPDTRRREKQPFDGRRIKAIEEGWLVLNGEKYREMVRMEMQRARNRRSQAAFRSRKPKVPKSQDKPASATYRSNESRYCEADENGDEAKADAIAAEVPFTNKSDGV